jgi:hypothetical protein
MRAKKLEQERLALRLTVDKGQIGLFRQDAEEPEHDARHSYFAAMLWTIASRALELAQTSSSIVVLGRGKNARMTGCGRNGWEPAVKSIS